MKTLRLFVGSCLVAAAAACGGDGSNAAGSDSSSPSNPSVKAVPHEKFLEFLPTLPGFKREDNPQGTTDPAENVSRVSASYNQEGGIGIVGVEITDSGRNPNVLLILRDELKAGGGRAVMGGEKNITRIAEYPAVTEWTPEVKSGLISVLVADRFIVGITGGNVADFSVLQKTVDAIDLKKLASLK